MTKSIRYTNAVNVVGIGLENLIAILVAEIPEGATELTLVCFRHADDKGEVEIEKIKTPKGEMSVEYKVAENANQVGMFYIRYVVGSDHPSLRTRDHGDAVDNVLNAIA